jgi:hypothetical protein
MKLQIGCAMLLCLACGKGDSQKSATSAPAEQAAPAEPAATPNKPSEPEPDPELKAIASLKADPVGKVKAYVVYHQHYLDVLKQAGSRSKEFKEKEKSGQFEGVTGAARVALQLNSLGSEAKAAFDKALAESGLSDPELTVLGGLMGHVQMKQQMQKGAAEVNPAKTAEQMAKYEQLIQSAPPEQREAMKKQVEEIKQAQVAMQEAVSLKDERAKFGDATVDAMLAALPELNAQLKQYAAATQ